MSNLKDWSYDPQARVHWDSWSQGALRLTVSLPGTELDPISKAILYAYATMSKLEHEVTEQAAEILRLATIVEELAP